MFIIIVFWFDNDRESGLLFFCTSFTFHTNVSLLSFCFFNLFHSCCSHERLFGKTRMHEFYISCSCSDWCLLVVVLWPVEHASHARDLGSNPLWSRHPSLKSLRPQCQPPSIILQFLWCLIVECTRRQCKGNWKKIFKKLSAGLAGTGSKCLSYYYYFLNKK